jgi:hypothetical protein
MGWNLIGYAAHNPMIALAGVLVVVSLAATWMLFEHVCMGVCDCWCGPGKCECGCGCKSGCPCFSRDKSAHNDANRRGLSHGS